MFKALIVEDQVDIQTLLIDILDGFPQWQFEVRTAVSGEKALHLAQALPPDLILLDIRLAGVMDGYEVARQIRHHPLTKEAKILMLSGLDDPWDEHLALKAGANTYITKPVYPRILQEALTRLMGDGASSVAAPPVALPVAPQAEEAPPAPLAPSVTASDASASTSMGPAAESQA